MIQTLANYGSYVTGIVDFYNYVNYLIDLTSAAVADGFFEWGRLVLGDGTAWVRLPKHHLLTTQHNNTSYVNSYHSMTEQGSPSFIHI